MNVDKMDVAETEDTNILWQVWEWEKTKAFCYLIFRQDQGETISGWEIDETLGELIQGFHRNGKLILCNGSKHYLNSN